MSGAVSLQMPTPKKEPELIPDPIAQSVHEPAAGVSESAKVLGPRRRDDQRRQLLG